MDTPRTPKKVVALIACNHLIAVLDQADKKRYDVSKFLPKNTKISSSISELTDAESANNTGPVQTRSSRQISAQEAERVQGLAGNNEIRGKVSLETRPSRENAYLQTDSLIIGGQGNLSETELRKTLEKYLPRFQYCYEKALLTDPLLAGVVRVQWTIREDGKPQNASISKSEVASPMLHKCLIREISRISFPKPTGGSVAVKYPFSFNSQM